MDNKKIKTWEKHEILESAVLEQSPSEVSKVFEELGEVWVTAFALGYACRFRGLEMVKVLVEGGATFKLDQLTIVELYRNVTPIPLLPSTGDLSLMLLSSVGLTYFKGVTKRYRDMGFELLPLSERLEILEYFCDNAGKIGFNPDEFLFYAYFSNEREMISALKNRGVTIPERFAEMITRGSDFWFDYCYLTQQLDEEDFVSVMSALRSEINKINESGEDKKLLYSDYFWNLNEDKLSKPELFRFLLDNFDQSKMKKYDLMKAFINHENVSCLEIAAEYGWLKQPKKRDEMIQYASDRGKTECTAWLLDFKNRTADLAAERLKAEKKMERELNAAPDSIMMMKKIWSYEKLEDGGIVIKRYKGNDIEIKVPEKIGKDTVVAVGKYAFSPNASRLTSERVKFLHTIKKITLPDTIKSIGASAFEYLVALETVNIPDGVEAIGKSVFTCCFNLVSMEFPDSVRELGETVFSSCKNLETVKLPGGIPEIGDTMFNYCAKLREIKIPDTVKRIGAYAFNGCVGLSEIVLPDGIEEIGNVAFHGCVNIKTIVLPASLKSIKNYKIHKNEPPVPPFADAKDIKTFVVPNSYAEQYCKRNEIPYEYMEEHKV